MGIKHSSSLGQSRHGCVVPYPREARRWNAPRGPVQVGPKKVTSPYSAIAADVTPRHGTEFGHAAPTVAGWRPR